jgi:uncharacterized membrane protein YeaQ/YmgE (transglycosylase-associated protein family)
MDRRLLGLAGAWVATLVLAAIWQADAVPWLWSMIQGVVLVWVGAVVMLMQSTATTFREKRPLNLFLTCCALICIGVNLVAGMHFLYIATVSPGGV